MDSEHNFVDLYEVLQSDRTATFDELKKNYQRLALSTHPDKARNDEEREFSLIQKAWTVLRDPDRRKQYDAELSCYEHNDLLLFDSINIQDMNYNDNIYTYSCRCGGTYTLVKASDSEPSKSIIGCDECSFSIEVNV